MFCIRKRIELKLKKNLMAYRNENVRLRNFAEKKVNIGEKMYDLRIFLLGKISETEYVARVKVALDMA